MIVHTLKMCTGDAGLEQSLVLFEDFIPFSIAISEKCWKIDIQKASVVGALLNFIWGLLFEKTYPIVIKDETDLKSKLNASTLILMGRTFENW